ncbi:hypothetical protein IX317_000561 [Fusobacterium sp. DD29]|uniref:autotransporter-associated N-terminal domain-containing protein n=1 Tax=unclassified Fusobacterium TaxID=2648384 RepID=UPI001B8CF216|nr:MULTISPECIES: autotransporter-associated N-terminal domain-containing protein [unclassified Fusobacterium]MBR8748900.1 hypothetical protein [Fusobacterium sp. DD29]MBR8761198.1 hypothetical protein [Fusobacterium sp. DD25]MBR8767210.1 hypothetical protein [Fusobacterium sp. DD43]MBR8771260.1 hypothetical protein [Fusobacterium sp. DD40]MBR8775455.1 hypothetical protein [Fusobacterium sp. DD17]
MGNKYLNESQKILKRFVKKSSRITYSTSLLVSFLITGAIGYSAEISEAIPTREELAAKVSIEKEHVEKIIKENKSEIDNLNLEIEKLLRRGAFWIKSLDSSYQVFFNGIWNKRTENKNRTKANFNSSEYTSNIPQSLNKWDTIYDGTYYGSNGVIKNRIEFTDSIDFGANIKPKSVDEKQLSVPNIIKKEVSLVSFNPPLEPVIEIETPNVKNPQLVKTVTPNIPSVHVDKPSDISSLTPVNVAEIKAINIKINEPKVVEPVKVNAPTVEAPSVPGGFNPRLIAQPDIPKIKEIVVPQIESPELTGGGANPSYNRYSIWWGTNAGMISQISVKKGIITIADNTKVEGYEGDASIAKDIGYIKSQSNQSETVSNGTYENQIFFSTLLNVPYSEFSRDVVINVNKPEYKVIDLETEGRVKLKTGEYGTIEKYKNRGYIDSDKNKLLKTYKAYSGIVGDNPDEELLFINKGKINLNASKSNYFFTTSHNDGNYRTNFIDNEGIITAKGTDSIIIKHSPDTSQAKAWIYSNTGKMYADGERSIIVGWAYKYLSSGRAGFINDGEIKVRGQKGIGVFFSQDEGNSAMRDGHLVYLKKSIDLLGDESIGFVSKNTGEGARNVKNLVNFTIGKEPPQDFGNINGNDASYVEKAIGILQDQRKETKAATLIAINNYAKESIGIYAKEGTFNTVQNKDLNIKNKIVIDGGKNNIAFGIENSAKIIFDGDIIISDGEGNGIGLLKGNTSSSLKITGNVKVGSENKFLNNSVVMYTEGSQVKLPENSLFYLSGNSVALYAQNSGTIDFSRINKNGNPTITIKSDDNQGTAVIAKDGGIINISNQRIKIDKGATSILAIGNNSQVNAQGATLDYDGNGYSVFAKDGGTINLTNGNIILRGKSIAMELNKNISNPVTFTNGKITVMSDDVNVFNLVNIGTIRVSQIKDDVKNQVGTNITIEAGTKADGSKYDKYRLAAVDGGNLDIDVALNKSDNNLESPSNYYFRRFLGQRLKINVNNNVTAKLNSKDSEFFNDQVVALEGNSSKKATSVEETQINLANATVEADRTDAGNGAVGLFINYGKVDIDDKSKILVEKGSNTVNNKAIGVYAVDGSIVTNKGAIEVGGNNSIGILGLAYRLDNGALIKNEFGGKTGEGNISITNSKDIKMSGENAIGIYAENNNTNLADSNHVIINTGNITTGDKGIGIYGHNVIITPELGNINISNKGIGIYSSDSKVGKETKDLGTVTFNGDNGIGIYLAGDQNKSTVSSGTLTLSNPNAKNGNIGLFVDYTQNLASYDMKTKVNVGDSNNITAYYSKSGDINLLVSGKINENSVGVAGATEKKLTYGNGNDSFTFEVGNNSTGIVGKNNDIVLQKNAQIQLKGEKSVGIYAEGEKKVEDLGKITLENKNTVGIYGRNKAKVELKDTSNIEFSSDSKESIGVYLAGSNANITDSDLTFNQKPENKNILIYLQGYNTEGSTITLKNLHVNPSETSVGDNRTIGVYMDTSVANNNGSVVNTFKGKVETENKGIGIYAKNSGNEKNIYNSFENSEILSKNEGTAGIFADGNIKIKNSAIKAQDKGIGIYGNHGTINIDGTNNIEISKGGTGIYLTNGSNLKGGVLSLKNDTTGTNAVGVYYNKGTVNGELNHDTELNIGSGNNLMALYIAGGVHIKNSKNIGILAGTENVATYLTGNSQFENIAGINIEGNSDKSSGIYVANGTGINSGKIVIKDLITPSSLSVGMAAVKDSGALKSEVINNKDIEVTGDAVGMYVADSSVGENSGKIISLNKDTLKSTGVYVNGQNAHFKNKGEIESQNIALALKNTKENNIKAGNLKLTANSAVGVYAANSVIDFDIMPIVNSGIKNAISLYADEGTKIDGKISAVNGIGNIGVYLKDSSVIFGNNSKIIVGNGERNNFGIGIYVGKGYNGPIKANVKQQGEKTIGISLESGDVSTTTKVVYSGELNVGKGIGVLVPEKTEFKTDNATFNIDGGAGIVIKKGKVDIGNAGNTKMVFGDSKGTAIYQEDGEINVGSNLIIEGQGSFITLNNSNSTIDSVIPVAKDGVGVYGVYNSSLQNYLLNLGPNGKINLNGDNSIGMAASVKGVSPNKVEIRNDGSIVSLSGKNGIGIYAKGATVRNNKIEVGTSGIGIYTTNEDADKNTKVESKSIILTGDDSIGIFANKFDSNEIINPGKIESKGTGQKGLYVKGNQSKTSIKDFEFTSLKDGIGVIFENGEFALDSTNKNKIVIGNTENKEKRGIGIVTEKAHGTISKTDIVLGKDSIGVYVKESTVKFDSGSIKSDSGDSILVYADKKSNIELENLDGGLAVRENGIALAVSGGKVSTTNPTDIKVNGVNGIGIYAKGDTSNPADISENFKVNVSNGGVGIYAKGNVTSYGTLTHLSGNNTKGYIFEDITHMVDASEIVLGEGNATGQIGVYAKGIGHGIKLRGLRINSGKNIGVYNTADQNIMNNGDIIVINNNSADTSVGIYSTNSDTSNIRKISTAGKIIVGENNVGIYGINTGVEQTVDKDITVDSNGIGILSENIDSYYGKGNIDVKGNITVKDSGIGIRSKNADIKLANNLNVGNNGAKGIYASEKGNINIVGDMTVGDNSIGIYKNGSGKIETTSGKNISIGENSYGIFTENSEIVNNSNIKVGKNGIGVAGTKNITSNGDIIVGDGGVGLYAKDSGANVVSSGIHTIGNDKAIGIYGENVNINVKSRSKMTIGEHDSIGVLSLGSGNITINGISGSMTVGKDSIGIYKKGTGNMKVSNSNLEVLDKGYGIYYLGTNKDGLQVENTNMNLGKEAVGVYGQKTIISYKGDIHVGETTIGKGGFDNPALNKNSIGIFGENSQVEYTGHMIVDKPLSVGLYAYKEQNGSGVPTASITLKSGAVLDVSNGGIGIMGGSGIHEILIEENAKINVDGSTNEGKNPSMGIVSYSGNIINKGEINLSNGASGVYLGGIASLVSEGKITVDATSNKIQLKGVRDANVGGIKITSIGKVTIDNRIITGGIVHIKGDLTMDGLGIDISTSKPVIKADNVEGLAYILPNFTSGNSIQKYTIPDVFRVAPEGIGTFTGDIKSASVSWIAKISSDPNLVPPTETRDITMVRIPYQNLIKGERYKNLGLGLEKVRLSIPKTEVSNEFKSLDEITTHEEFASALADIRGDIYSNIQERMRTVENIYDRSYEELLSSYNVTRNVNKFSVINARGKHRDNTLGVAGYKYNSTGLLYLRDNERYSYGGKFGWSAGITETKFDFEGKTNRGSKERILSGKVGVHYQKALNKHDEDVKLKYLTRAELTLNRHSAKRYMQLGNDVYRVRSTYYSTNLSWKNRVMYDYDITTQWTIKPYAGVDFSYGHFSTVKEKDDTLALEIKDNNYFITTPNVGVETKYRIPFGENKQVILKADSEVDYDMNKLYTKANEAKLKKADTEYYKLSEPKADRLGLSLGAEIGIEKTDNYGVTLRAEYNKGRKSDINYGIHFNLKF